ncbi:MAG: tripartite tricarboxylate transporter substrate-binding protein [Pseudomonadota bacterium]
MLKSMCRLALAASLAVAGVAAGAQQYPTKTVRLVAPVEPGSPTDTIARLVAQRLSVLWGQQVVVDNRPSVNGVVGSDIVARAPADGYTLLAGNSGTQVMNIGLYKKLSYNPVKDFVAISQVVTSPLVLMGSNHFAPRTVPEVIAGAKSASINFAIPGATAQLASLMFDSAAGVDIVSIPYKGSSGAETALLAGDAQLFFASISNALPYVRSGRMKAIAVTSLARTPVLPETPTLDEAGLKGFELDYWVGLFAPAALPGPVTEKINGDVMKVLQMKEVRERILELGYTPAPRQTAAFGQYVKTSAEKYARLMHDLGIQPQ